MLIPVMKQEEKMGLYRMWNIGGKLKEGAELMESNNLNSPKPNHNKSLPKKVFKVARKLQMEHGVLKPDETE
jgi:hypothetical protein